MMAFSHRCFYLYNAGAGDEDEKQGSGCQGTFGMFYSVIDIIVFACVVHRVNSFHLRAMQPPKTHTPDPWGDRLLLSHYNIWMQVQFSSVQFSSSTMYSALELELI